METIVKIVKVYSNNSKKSRLKRNKNKFQRVWDAEKQTYIKVRKAKYPVKSTTTKDWRKVDNSAALKRRRTTTKKPKSVPVSAQQTQVKVQKPEIKQQQRKEPARVSKPKTTTVMIHGVKHAWDSQTMRYKRAA